MKIKNDGNGYRIEPETDHEKDSLKFLIEALEEKYCISYVTTSIGLVRADFYRAIQALLLNHDQDGD